MTRPVLEDGATFKILPMPLEDMQFVENQQLTRTDIAVAFRIPPSYLGGTTGDSLTYTTKEANTSQMAQLAIMPWTTSSNAPSAQTPASSRSPATPSAPCSASSCSSS